MATYVHSSIKGVKMIVPRLVAKKRFALSALFLFVCVLISSKSSLADVAPQIASPEQVPVPRHRLPQQNEGGLPVAGGGGFAGQVNNWFGRVQNQLVNDSFEIHPHARTEYELDGNVLLEANNAKIDSILREEVGTGVKLPFMKKHSLAADYTADLEQFAKLSGEKTQNQYFTSNLELNFKDLYIRGREDITHTSSRSGTTLTERVPRLENSTGGLAGYRFNRFVIEGGYDSFYRRYNASPQMGLDYHAQGFNERVFVDITPKTQAFIEHQWTIYEYMKSNRERDGIGNNMFAGIRGKVLPKTALYTKLGYGRIDYKRATDAKNFVGEVGLNYQPWASTRADFGWTRSIEQATFSTTNFLKQDALFLTVSQKITEKISGKTTVSFANQGYKQTASTGGVTPSFTGKRDDNLFSSSTVLSYSLSQWINAGIEYQYSRRNSNAGDFDYVDNALTIGLGLAI